MFVCILSTAKKIQTTEYKKKILNTKNNTKKNTLPNLNFIHSYDCQKKRFVNLLLAVVGRLQA